MATNALIYKKFRCIIGKANLFKRENGGNVMNVLVINCGSSSLKYQVLDMTSEKLLCKGLVERIGMDGS